MEKDNKKAREDARREYNETVRVSVPTTQLYHHPSHSSPTVPRKIHQEARSTLQGPPSESRLWVQHPRSCTTGSLESNTTARIHVRRPAMAKS